jgi:hypothetical protein
MVRRALAYVVAGACLVLAVQAVPAGAQTAPNTSHWVVTHIPGSKVTFRRPASLVKIANEKTAAGRRVLTFQDKSGDPYQGRVVVDRSPLSQWSSNFPAWDATTRAVIKQANGAVLSSTQATVGSLPAYESISAYQVPSGATNVVGILVVRDPKSIFSISLSVPQADMADIQPFMDAVKP